jgi:hypothetical protein
MERRAFVSRRRMSVEALLRRTFRREAFRREAEAAGRVRAAVDADDFFFFAETGTLPDPLF